MGRRVEPIRDYSKINQIKNKLKREGKYRDYALFTCGINLGLRIGDLLSLQVKDVRNYNNEIKEQFEIIEQKTGKRNIIKINEESKNTLDLLFEKTGLLKNDKLKPKIADRYLFYHTQKKPDGKKAITPTHANRLIKKWCYDVGIHNIPIGSHTLRKSWGFWAFKNGIPIEVIQSKYKHNTTATTRQYLGIQQQDVNDAYNKVNL